MEGKDAPRCLQEGPDCEGPVEWVISPDRTDFRAFPRCQRHKRERLAKAERNMRDYPDSPIAPSWFDPSYAGESWDED